MRMESRLNRKAVLTVMFVSVFIVLHSAAYTGQTLPEDQREGNHLYRFSMLQAGPGQLMELIEVLKTDVDSLVSEGAERPYIVRHSQGDHWDLLVIYPLGGKKFLSISTERAELEAETRAKVRPFLSWHEDLYVTGPSPEILTGFLDGRDLVHFEMMQSLPGKFDDLVEERRMENRYNVMRGADHTLIFTHVAGASWDVVTLGAYKDWAEYAVRTQIPRDLSEKAAKKAGFPSAGEVGAFMRTLISTHRDTLGPVIY